MFWHFDIHYKVAMFRYHKFWCQESDVSSSVKLLSLSTFKRTVFSSLWTMTQRFFFHNFITRIHKWHKNARKTTYVTLESRRPLARDHTLTLTLRRHFAVQRFDHSQMRECPGRLTSCGLKFTRHIGDLERRVVVESASMSGLNSSFSLKAMIFSNKSWTRRISLEFGCPRGWEAVV